MSALSALLATTFDNDPVYVLLFPELASRRAGLTDFFARNLRVHLPYRCTHVAIGESGDPVATVTVRPPEGFHISLPRLARHLLPFALRRGPSAARRVLWVKKTYEAMEKETARRQAHAYVHMMAVTPSLHGRGIGRELLTRVLTRVRDASPSAPTVLSTHSAKNVVFYQRHGFEVDFERTVSPPRGQSYPVWSMRLAPAADAPRPHGS